MGGRWALLWVALCVGCASGGGGGADDCQDRTCPRGQACRAGRCVEVETDGAVVDSAVRDSAVVDAQVRDAVVPDAMMIDAVVPDAMVLPDAAPRDAVVGDAAPESCQPGQVDDCGSNIGRCRRGRRVCGDDGTWGECTGEVAPRPEICNGADDDCNGTVDDGFGTGEPCRGVGACGDGHVECRDNVQTRCSTDPGGTQDQSHAERCNGADDDCDGMVDEDFHVGRDCTGHCGPGALECAADGTAMCSTDPGGSESVVHDETCNGRDDNCDGTVDEGFGLGGACDGVGACGAGVVECAPGGMTRCSTDAGGSQPQAVDELCNGADDDCDGHVDEDLGLGAPCEGVGACGMGTTECDAAGNVRCSTDPGGSQSQAGVEACNGLDDDCDGMADEGLGVGDPCPAVGICAAGQRECGANAAVVCDTGPGGAHDGSHPEACNGLDDDCDGRVDDGFDLGQACRGQGVCGAGVVECDGQGGAHCSTEPGGSHDASGEEACNGLDDDCDGMVDEGGACGGDTCAEAPPLALGAEVSGDTTMLANDYVRSTCLANSAGNDQVFRIAIPAAGSYVVGVAPAAANFDPMFYVSIACDGGDAASCLLATSGRDANRAGRPEAKPIQFPRADTFWVVVDSRAAGAGGPFLVSVRPTAQGETCGTALPLALPARFVGSTESGAGGRLNDVAGVHCPDNRSTVGPDQIFSIAVPHDGRLRVQVTPDGQNVDPIVQLVRDCNQIDATCVVGVDNAGAGGVETLDAQVQAGNYFLIIDHTGNPGGAFFLEADLQ